MKINELMKKAFTFKLNHPKEKKALIVYGGEDHNPEEVANFIAGILREEHFSVQQSNSLNSFLDLGKLKRYDLIILLMTRGTITREQLTSLLEAVKGGVGFVGIHQTVGAFRAEIEFHHMIGGQFLAHPGGANVTYRVHITDQEHSITKGIEDFNVTTEKYYMLIDPVNKILADTYFDDEKVNMPVVWTKNYGTGNIFYCSLGHTLDILKLPQVMTLLRRGMSWAAR